MKELPVPDAAREHPNSVEVLRAWVVDGQQYVSLRAAVWDDPAAWGVMLADFARHVAIAYEQDEGLDRAAVLLRIKAGLDAEFESPTDQPTGRITG